jgi:nucleoside-diphosphate-sugar epimerase
MTDQSYIVVTGSQGFVGKNLVEELAKKSKVLAFDLRPPEFKVAGVEYIHLDCGDPDSITRYFAEFSGKISMFYNLAAYYNFNNLPAVHDSRLLEGLPVWAEIFKSHKNTDALFLQASSMASLAPVEPGVQIHSSAPSLERWSYPAFKKKSEDVLRKHLVDCRYVEFVIGAVYSDFCELVPLYNFIEAHRNKEIYRWFHPAPLNRGLTYIHCFDLIEAMLQAGDLEFSSRRLLIGEHEATTYETIGERVDDVFFKRKIPKLIVPEWSAKFGARMMSLTKERLFYQSWMIDFAKEHYEFDISETIDQLQWSPKYQLYDKLGDILGNALKHPAKWKKLNEARPWHIDDWGWLNQASVGRE